MGRRGSAQLGLAIGLLALAGCGSSSTATTAPPQAAAPSTATSSTTATTPPAATTPASPSGPTYSDSFTITQNNFTFRVHLNAALGTPSTNTQGLSPPKVNIVVPVTGSGTITNEASGYTATAQDIPALTLYALYPSSAANCPGYLNSEVKSTAPRHQAFCRVTVADYEIACPSAASAEPTEDAATTPAVSLAPNTESPLTACQGTGVGTSPGPAGTMPTLGLSESTSTEAPRTIAEVKRQPVFWVVAHSVNANECGGDPTEAEAARGPTNNVIASEPAGLKGCIGPEEP
jgi:hypothetical protein